MADARILHVSSTYANYYRLDVSATLEQMSKNILNKIKGQYMKGGNDSFGANENNAQILQEFFQMIKKAGNSNSKTTIEDAAKESVINSVLNSYRSYNGVGPRGGAKKRVFNTRSKKTTEQGEAFEKELAAIIAAVRLEAEGSGGNGGKGVKAQFRQAVSSMQLGRESVGFENIVKDTAKGVIIEINEKMSNVICDTESKLGKYVISSVQGKIDVSGLGVEWKINAEPSSYLQQIANLLSQASFTAKSYSSLMWNGKSQIKSSRTSLKLGNTEQRRVFYTVLMAQGIPVKVAESIYQHTRKTHNNEEKKNAQRLRILYELTGYGQKYINNMIDSQLKMQLGGTYANYIIFNDPATDNIYVKTTAQIWEEMMKQYLENFNNKELFVSKSLFY